MGGNQQLCLAVAEKLTGSKFGFIGEISSDGKLDDIAISDPGWTACIMNNSLVTEKLAMGFTIHFIYGRVLSDGTGFFTNNLSGHLDGNGLPNGHTILTAFLGIPLWNNGRRMGMVGLGNSEGGYSEEDLECLEI